MLSCGLCALPTHAVEVVVGQADVLALDQPRITFGLTDESTSPATLIGPRLPGSALLDTGANGILLAQQSYLDGEDYGFVGVYNELGVAGTSPLNVHDTFGLRISDSDGVQRLVGTDVRPFGDDGLSLGSFNAIVGMPAMEGYVVEVDMRPSLSLAFQRVAFHDTMGAAAFESATQLDVGLRIVPPEYTDTEFPVEFRPTFSGLPVLDMVDMRHTGGSLSPGGQQVADDYTFLIDTGAQTMIISGSMAADLGIDARTPANDGVTGADVIDFLEVGGIGGTVDMPIVVVDEFVMPTKDGIDVVWTDLNVGVLDIDGAPFDAVLGMNLFTTGYLDAVFGTGDSDPLLDKVVFDFLPTDGTASMRLDFADALYTPGDLDLDGDIDNADIGLVAGNFTGSGGSTTMRYIDGDVDGDGDIDNADLGLVAGGFTGSLAEGTVYVVPEPGSLLLLTAAGLATIGRRRR